MPKEEPRTRTTACGGPSTTAATLQHPAPDTRLRRGGQRVSWPPRPGPSPSHISIRHQHIYPGKPQEQSVQWTPHHGTPPRSSNLAREFALVLVLVTAKHLITDPLELKPQPLHFGRLAQDRLATCTCPPLPRPPPEPPNSVLAGRIHTRTSSGPLQLPTWPSQLMARLRQLYSAWYNVLNETILPLMITAPQPKGCPSNDNIVTLGMSLDQEDK